MSQFYHNSRLLESERSKSRSASRQEQSHKGSIASLRSLNSRNGGNVQPDLADLAFDEKMDSRQDESQECLLTNTQKKISHSDDKPPHQNRLSYSRQDQRLLISTESATNKMKLPSVPVRVTESTEVKMSIFEHALAVDSREYIMKGHGDIPLPSR